METTHTPVMRQEAIAALAIEPAGVYIDGTFGRGGHARALLEQLGPEGWLLCFDRDPEAIQAAQQDPVLQQDPRFSIHQGSFAELKNLFKTVAPAGIDQVDGILLDLGVSSPQLDDPRRGFSFQQDGPLDMRMDPTQGTDAATWLNSAKEEDIADVLFTYGEERYSRRIARLICRQRQEAPIETTRQLARLIEKAVPSRERKKHPATRSFQAIRILINEELQGLADCLEQSLNLLKPGGRLVVISFHSLEDRVVKRFIQLYSGQGQLRAVGRALKADEDGVRQNVRARSAVLRVAERS